MSEIPYDRIRGWIDAALPFWAEHGVDHAHGGFLEELSREGEPTEIDFKRIRVICRQVYVFSHAALRGWDRGHALSQFGYDYLVKNAWLGPDRGWARVLSRRGEVLDATPDLYDLAFVLFALAWRFRVTQQREIHDLIEQTLRFIQNKMSAGELGGYWHRMPPEGPRLQNPHMHLLEAILALADATGEHEFVRMARDLVDLFRTRFFDGRTLAEYFSEDLRRLGGDRGRVIEPGHHFEWAWILAHYERLSGDSVLREADALVAFAETHGVDVRTQAVRDQVRDDGFCLTASSRTWPNTERIKAHLALFELAERDPRPAVHGSVMLLLDRYLTPSGSWIDQFDGDGRPIAAAAPASTFYHVFLAFAEVLRLEPRLSRVDAA